MFHRTLSTRRTKPQLTRQLKLENLEARQLLAADLAIQLRGDTLVLTGSDEDDAAWVRSGSDSVTAYISNGTSFDYRKFDAGFVKSIDFFGLAGDDRFENQTNIPVDAYGGAGNDTLIGGSANDRLFGDDNVIDMLVGDIDKDGAADHVSLIYHDTVGLEIRTRLGAANSLGANISQQTSLDSAGFTQGTHQADVNGDGRMDFLQFIQLSSNSQQIRSFISAGDGTWNIVTQTMNGADYSAQGILIGDLDGDKDSDILQIAPNGYYGQVIVTKLSNGDGTWQSQAYATSTYGSSMQRAQLADVNGDGRKELIQFYAYGSYGQLITTRFRAPNGMWESRTTSTADDSSIHSRGTYLGDVNGDGREDLIQFHQYWMPYGQQVRTRLSNGDGTWTTVLDTKGDADVIYELGTHLGDFNGDGLMDFVQFVHNPQGTEIRTKLADGTGHWIQKYNQTSGGATYSYGTQVADLNGDGCDDFVHHYLYGGGTGMAMRRWTSDGDGDGTFTFRSLLTGSGLGDDVLWGGAGNDLLLGGAGNDTLRGDNGHDFIYGGSGDDWLYGGNGNDQLFGEAGNDNLYGEFGSDQLDGGAGNDGLFAGAGISFSIVGTTPSMIGGGGSDRFLVMGKTASASARLIRDLRLEDAVIYFNDLGKTSDQHTGMGTVEFAAGYWTESEIQMIDQALSNLHREVGNTRLLKKSNGAPIVIHRAGAQLTQNGHTINGWNGSEGIAITSSGVTKGTGLLSTIYHEVGHNWDDPSENSSIKSFRQLSGWVQYAYASSTASAATGDNWYYNSRSSFARDYGRWNPFEDYATTWETHFMDKYHGGSGNNRIDAKLANVDAFFRSLA